MRREPRTESELIERASSIVGLTLAKLASNAGISPIDGLRDKGWVGRLVEWYLGVVSRNNPQQDFAELGIEVKTVPVSYTGKTLEATSVCTAPLTGVDGLTWENSRVRNKLSRVLWIPVEGDRAIPVKERKIGPPLTWSPSDQEDRWLHEDWEELMELIVLGKVERITARHGQYLQLKPKAANSQVRTDAYSYQGRPMKAIPRGFYLRSQFTSYILEKYLNQ